MRVRLHAFASTSSGVQSGYPADLDGAAGRGRRSDSAARRGLTLDESVQLVGGVRSWSEVRAMGAVTLSVDVRLAAKRGCT